MDPAAATATSAVSAESGPSLDSPSVSSAAAESQHPSAAASNGNLPTRPPATPNLPPLALSPSRVEFILTGAAVSSSAAVAAAYRAGLRAAEALDVAMGGAAAAAAQAELTPRALADLLRADDARLRTVALHGLLALARAAADECGLAREVATCAAKEDARRAVEAGALPADSAVLKDAAAAHEAAQAFMPAASEHVAAFHDALAATHALPLLLARVADAAEACAARPCDAAGVLAAVAPELELALLASGWTGTPPHVRGARLWHEQCGVGIEHAVAARAAFGVAVSAAASLPAGHAAAVDLHRAVVLYQHTADAIERRVLGAERVVEVRETTFSSPRFSDAGVAKAMFKVMMLAPRTEATEVIARTLWACGDVPAFLAVLAAPGEEGEAAFDGFRATLDALSSTVHNPTTMGFLLGMVANCSVDSKSSAAWARGLISRGAFKLLQPALVSSSPSLCLSAAFTVAALAAAAG